MGGYALHIHGRIPVDVMIVYVPDGHGFLVDDLLYDLYVLVVYHTIVIRIGKRRILQSHAVIDRFLYDVDVLAVYDTVTVRITQNL